VDEKILPQKNEQTWTIEDIEEAFKFITNEAYSTTLFDNIIKSIESNEQLYSLIFDIIFNGFRIKFTISDPVIFIGATYGILGIAESMTVVHNRIFEQRLYAHMLSRELIKRQSSGDIEFSPDFYMGNDLNLKVVLQRFQLFMRENYSDRDAQFIEREGRLLFLSFLKPIINGKGFDFKEPNVADERRMDVVITYNNLRYVVELKIWRGEAYHQRGLQQLSNYLDIYSLKKGYLLIFDFNQNKTYKEETIFFGDKEIFAVWV